MLRYFLLVSVCRASNACRLAVVSDIGSCNNEDTMSLAPEIASPTTSVSVFNSQLHTSYPARSLKLQIILDLLQSLRPHVGSSYSAPQQSVDSLDV
jgi:hypothetical protein